MSKESALKIIRAFCKDRSQCSTCPLYKFPCSKMDDWSDELVECACDRIRVFKEYWNLV